MAEPWKQLLLQLFTVAVGPDIPGDGLPPCIYPHRQQHSCSCLQELLNTSAL